MRTTDEISHKILNVIQKAPDERKEILVAELLKIEVLVDIRDILDRGIFHLIKLIEDFKEKQ